VNRRLLVDLEALVANYRLFQTASQQPDAEVGAVIKADGYGTGAAAAARELRAAGCESFFVASADEGIALRNQLDPTTRIYVFEGPDPSNSADVAAAALIPVMNHPAQLECWRPFADMPIAVHIDTGMSRLGFPSDVDRGAFAGFGVELLLTHLACADEPHNPHNQRQLERFAACRRKFPEVRTSIGNSAGWLSGSQTQGLLGRPGIGLFGGNPFADRDNPCQPVATLQGRVLQVKKLAAGTTVGYGASYATSRPMVAAVVALGYADGVPRLLSSHGEMAVDHHRCPIVGRVSMDMTVIDVSRVPDPVAGAWVECFGSTITIDEVAGWANTIAYEVLTGVGPRVRREYRHPPG